MKTISEVKMSIKIKLHSCIFPECQDIPSYNIYDINSDSQNDFVKIWRPAYHLAPKEILNEENRLVYASLSKIIKTYKCDLKTRSAFFF